MSSPQNSLLAQYQLQFSTALRQPGSEFSSAFVPKRGLEVYQDAYRIRIEESLEEDFPILARILGDSEFSALVERFLEARGSQFASLSELGKSFVPYIAECEVTEELPFLFELADYEWTRILSELLGESDLMPAAGLGGESRVLLSPSAQLWSGNWPVHLLEDDEIPPTIQPEKTDLLIWLRAGERQLCELTPAEVRLFQAMRGGATVGELGEVGESMGFGEAELLGLFKRWVSDRVISGWRKEE